MAACRRLGVLLVFISLAAMNEAASAETLDNLAGVVQIQQTRSFADVQSLERTVQTAPPLSVEVPRGSSPSELIRRLYGFGASDSRDAYRVMESRVLELNGLQDPTQLPAGRVLVPDLPKLTSKPLPGDSPLGPAVRNLSRRKSIQFGAASTLSSQAYSKPIAIRDPISESLTYTRVDRYLATEAMRVAAEASAKGGRVAAGIEAGIQLAANPADCAHPPAEVLTPDERMTIQKRLENARDHTERYVFILDTGWPSAEDQRRSLQSMRSILDAVRRAVRISTSSLSRFTTTIHEPDFVPISHAHACLIWNSLREFVQLDSNKRIHVLYLPLRPGQVHARELFRELIELDHLLTQIGGDLFQRSPSPLEIRAAKSFTEAALSQLPALKEPWTAGDDVVRIYEPLISGLVRILDTYARINSVNAPGMAAVDARFWLSLSWNFTKYAATPTLPTSSSYMVFAAAGNDGQDFVAGRRLFASEATMGRRVFAVMNNDQAGTLTCSSALYPTLWKEEEPANIASFPGRLGATDTLPCPGRGGGTSFSTPRLAWLSAASDVSTRAANSNWPKTLSQRLLKSREKVDSDPNAAPIRVFKLFSP